MFIRSYEPNDEALAIHLWNDALPMDQINKENFYRRIIYDINFDPAKYFLLFDGKEPAGFLYCTKQLASDGGEVGVAGVGGVAGDKDGGGSSADASGGAPVKGWIVAMGVLRGYRRRGAGQQLITAAEALLKSEGANQIIVGAYAENYFCPGVDKINYHDGVCFFQSMGYSAGGECCSMDISLRDYVYPEKYKDKRRDLESQGYIFKLYEACDTIPLRRFMRECFPHWLPNVRDCLLSGRASERLILAIDKGGDAVGFVMRAMDGTEERFGPFGVNPNFQGIGLGSILFAEMMQSMIERRIFYTYFLWTSGRNLDIYSSWGMKIYRSYCMMEKTI